MCAVIDAVHPHEIVVPFIGAVHTAVFAALVLVKCADLPCCIHQPDLAVADVAAEQHICRYAVRCALELHGANLLKIRHCFALFLGQLTENQMIRCFAVIGVFHAVHANAVKHKDHGHDRDGGDDADTGKDRLPLLRPDIAGCKQIFISHCVQPPPAHFS